MVRLLLLTICALMSSPLVSAGATPVATVVDYLRETPAFVNGTIRLHDRLDLGSSGVSGLRIIPSSNPDEDISFGFNENYLRLTSTKAMRVTVAGISFAIRELSFNRETGKFTVKVKTPMGIGSDRIARGVAAALETHFKPRLLRAMNQVAVMRRQRSLADANRVLQSVLGIFTEGPGRGQPMPRVTGDLGLVFTPPRDRRLSLGALAAEVKGGDAITARIDFRYANRNFVIDGLSFHSQEGLRVSPGNTSIPEFASILIRRLNIDGNGINMDYAIGAEEMVASFTVLIQMVQAYTEGPGRGCTSCETRLEFIRRGLDRQLADEIARFIRTYRASLLEAGASPRVLNALD